MLIVFARNAHQKRIINTCKVFKFISIFAKRKRYGTL